MSEGVARPARRRNEKRDIQDSLVKRSSLADIIDLIQHEGYRGPSNSVPTHDWILLIIKSSQEREESVYGAFREFQSSTINHKASIINTIMYST